MSKVTDEIKGATETVKKAEFEALWPIVRTMVRHFLTQEHMGKETHWQDMESEAALRLWQLIKIWKIDLNQPPGNVAQFLSKTICRLLRDFQPETGTISIEEVEKKIPAMPNYITDSQYWDMLSTLPERDKGIVVLSFFSGYSQKEVSQLYQVSEATVSNVINAFKKELKVKLLGD